MLKSSPRTWGALIVRGENLFPSRLTEELSISPDFVIERGMPNLQNKPSIPHWQLNSPLPPERSVEEHIFAILKKIAPRRQVFREQASKWECVLYLSVELADLDTDGLKLSPRVLLLLGDLGIHLEFVPWALDFYGGDLRGEERYDPEEKTVQ